MKIERIFMVLQFLIVMAAIAQIVSAADQDAESSTLTTTVISHVYLGGTEDVTVVYPNELTNPDVIDPYTATSMVTVYCNTADWSINAKTDVADGKLMTGGGNLTNPLTASVDGGSYVTLSPTAVTVYGNGTVGEHDDLSVAYSILGSWYDTTGVYTGIVTFTAVP